MSIESVESARVARADTVWRFAWSPIIVGALFPLALIADEDRRDTPLLARAQTFTIRIHAKLWR